jgi:hypothetical protein
MILKERQDGNDSDGDTITWKEYKIQDVHSPGRRQNASIFMLHNHTQIHYF